jgi:acyl carrier protein phosphodiesterase
MARFGVTQEQVSQIAERLKSEGIPVTPRLVRERLGSGSYSTICQYLKVWREKQEALAKPQVPEIPAFFGPMTERLWETAWEYALAQLAFERRGIEAMKHEFERERHELMQEIERLEQKIEELERGQ